MPGTFADFVHAKAPGSNLPMGRNEEAMALESLLHVTHEGTQIQAVNNTDEIALIMESFLCNTVDNKDNIAGEISSVYAVGTLDGDVPRLLFCHSASTYTCVFFNSRERM